MTGNRYHIVAGAIFCLLFVFGSCTYDATPPDESSIHDQKQTLMIDAVGLTAQRLISLRYTDALGSTTLETSREKTDANGRLLYPLLMARGTRTYTVTIIVDASGDGAFSMGSGDKTYTQTSSFTTDNELRKLPLVLADFSAY
jgi:hypothetical protein